MLRDILASDFERSREGRTASRLQASVGAVFGESFDFQAGREGDGGFTISIARCPWVDLLAKSGRQQLAGQIGHRICDMEYSVWAAEFGPGIVAEFGDRICDGCSSCVVRFRASA